MSTIITLSIALLFTFFAILREVKRAEEKNPRLFKSRFENKQPWSFEETMIVAYISLNYKMVNRDLISFVSDTLERDESTVIRKMNRIRGIGTGKSPRASMNDIGAYNLCKNLSPEDAKIRFNEATLELCIIGNSYKNLKSLLDNSLRVKPVLAVA